MIEYKKLIGKKIFLETLKNSKYSGEVLAVDDSDSNNGLIFIEIKDKFGQEVIFCTSEIAKLEVMRG